MIVVHSWIASNVLRTVILIFIFYNLQTFFNRVASSPAGAYSLLRHGLMKRLAECEVFAMRPEHER